MTRSCCRLISFTLALTLVFSTFPAPAVAGMIGTGEVLEQATGAEHRAYILSVLERDEVVAQLERHGVGLADARARVDALSDAEARLMAARMAEMPAGADSILGVLFAVFVILLVTDLLGLTSVFPFTRPRGDL